MSVKLKYLNYEIIKMNLTVAFKKIYITHFFRQFVTLKKSRRQFIFLCTPGGNPPWFCSTRDLKAEGCTFL